MHSETVNHLFFECNTSYIWALCKLKLGTSQKVSTLIEEARLLNSTFRAKSKATALARLVIVAAIWQIWKEKNMRIFQHKELKNTHGFIQMQRDALTLLHGCRWGEDPDKAKAEILQNLVTPITV